MANQRRWIWKTSRPLDDAVWRTGRDNLLIRRSPAARHDLDKIWYAIGIYNVEAADRVIDLIENRMQQLRDHPLSGQPRYDLGPSIRHLVAGQYLVFYRVTEDDILIVRVFHGNRRLPARL